MSRLTKKSGHHYYAYGIKEKENKNGAKRQYGEAITKLGKLEDLMEEYEIEDIDELRKTLNDFDDNCLVNIIMAGYLKEKGLAEDFKKKFL